MAKQLADLLKPKDIDIGEQPIINIWDRPFWLVFTHRNGVSAFWAYDTEEEAQKVLEEKQLEADIYAEERTKVMRQKFVFQSPKVDDELFKAFLELKPHATNEEVETFICSISSIKPEDLEAIKFPGHQYHIIHRPEGGTLA